MRINRGMLLKDCRTGWAAVSVCVCGMAASGHGHKRARWRVGAAGAAAAGHARRLTGCAKRTAIGWLLGKRH